MGKGVGERGWCRPRGGEWAAGLLGEKEEKKEEKGQDLKKIIIL